jgi:hypothetical protein
MEVQQKPFAVLKAQLEQYYKVVKPENVQKFIEEHPYLEVPLLEIPDKLKEYFDDIHDLQLRYVRDYDAPENTALLIFARTNREQEKIFEITDRLSTDWWDSISHNIHHRIVISVF